MVQWVLQRGNVADVFGELGFFERRALRRLIEVRNVDAGERLMSQGEPGDVFMFLLDGEALVEVDGHEVRTAGAGEFFGELALLPEVAKSEGRRVATVTTISPSTIGVCDHATFAQLFDEFPKVAGQILAQAWALTS